ncbi:hypothetical protein L484_019219 [Morus notabilis]|uniref:Ataxin-10 domain-containing protein n=1 Tax=Morus notabilis TaxID=981085 RepID=W9R1D0_9ROSA|nr:uncharacterized protein LOC21402166 [Morus notabilis]EXB51226.1 hypothetical protein L484_019219 [Morus notabilis]
MEDTSLLELCVEEDVIHLLCSASNSPTLEKSLESLIEVSRTVDGRADLASRRILPVIIQLVRSLPYPLGHQLLLLSLRLLRNLCAGEVANQNIFVEQNGVGAVLNVFRSARLCSGADYGIIRIGLQVLANVSLAGEEHQREMWRQFFPQEFLSLARLRSREVCDPLCMVIFTCCDGNPGLLTEICSGYGLPIAKEIISTTAADILNERIEEITVPNEFASRVLGYSLTILRDICSLEDPRGSEEKPVDAVSMLLSSGLVELLLSLLRELEPPAIIRKAMKRGENEEGNSCSAKPCPYKGFRRDIVAVIGNCSYGRKQVQDEIRQKNGILLLLQQCVTDEDNPFLREWGIWSVRNLLEGNEENQRVVAELELQGSVNTPEIFELGLRVEVDPNSRSAKLVNISGAK